MKKVHRVIKFNQKDWLKLYNHMNVELRQKSKNDFEKDFVKLMNNAVFGKAMKNVRKHKDIKFVTKENYHTKNIFMENLLAVDEKNSNIN